MGSHHRRSRRAAIAAAAVIGVGLATWVGWRLLAPGGREPAVTLQTAEVRRGDLVVRVTATGTLSPVVLVAVGSQISGTILELGADYNSRVTAGQVIARLDPRFLESAVAQARARLASARAELRRSQAAAANARAQYARLRPLVDKGISPPADLDASVAERAMAEAQITVAQAAILQARAALDQAEVNLAYSTIRAPIDGVVVSRNVDVGQTVAASLQSPTLFTIAGDLRRMEVHTSVAESDVGQVREGMRAEFTVDAFPGKTFAGSVKQVRFEATTVQNVVTYDAVIEVANEALELRPGMTASVSFIVAERHDVLLVPSRALRYRPAAARASAGQPERRGPQAVWALRGGVPVAVRVRAGQTDGTATEVEGELRPGELVITADAATGAAAPGSQPRAPRMPRIL